MPRRDIGTDDPRVKVRAAKSKPRRSKIKVDHSRCPEGFVYAIDRGRYRVRIADVDVTAVKARELGKGGIVVGDRVLVSGDISGRKDTLARIVQVLERSTLLRRSTEDTPDAAEKPMVANAQVLGIVAACADPVPRPGMIDRCLAAAYTEGLEPVLILTKSDLISPEPMRALFEPLGVRVIATAIPPQPSTDPCLGLDELREALAGKISVLIGHSGVGKSTLMNHLIPQAERATGHVNAVTGRGRHTSTASLALPFEGGWLIDTPGIRSFGLAHLEVDDLLSAFPDLYDKTELCPKLCSHMEQSPGCQLPDDDRRTQSLRRLLQQISKPAY